MQQTLEKFRVMRKIYRASSVFDNARENYKSVGISMGELLIENFPFARWPNYLHKVIEHVQELLSVFGSIGSLSSEGNEAGNKLFRLIRKTFAARNNTKDSLRDVLRVHWLYSSPALRKLVSVLKQKHSCSVCGLSGQNRLTCKIQVLDETAILHEIT